MVHRIATCSMLTTRCSLLSSYDLLIDVRLPPSVVLDAGAWLLACCIAGFSRFLFMPLCGNT